MTPEPDLPTRDENHSRSTWSVRAFESILPREWVVHLIAEDYGIDRRVEVFENGHTTGIFFNVQLKSTRTGSGHQPAESIKRTTLNYWAQTPDATLVVIAHDPTETLWFRWAHPLPYDANPRTKSRQVRCEEILDAESAARLSEEARAWRLARDLSRHLPIDVHLQGSALHGESATPLRRAIAQKLSALPSFVRVVYSSPALPYLRVSIEDTRVLASLRGNYEHEITWDLHGVRDYSALACDVIASIALSCASVGAEDLSVRLLKIAAPGTHTLIEANAFGYAVALLTRHGETEAILTLLRRAAATENHRAHDIALAAVSSARPTPELLRAVARVVRDGAEASVRPAARFYNAGNMLRAVDPREALLLYEEAAQADPAYRARGYWWREKGSAHWGENDLAEAETCYRRAVELGDLKASAYLGDLLMRTGRYQEARDIMKDAPIWDEPQDAQWRLTLNALNLIVDELGVSRQERDGLAIPDFYPEPANDSMEALEATALDAIGADALNGWAYSGLAAAWRGNEDKDSLLASLTAAVTINTAGYLWIHLLMDALADQHHDEKVCMLIAQDAMWCAWTNFGDAFADEILGYPGLPDNLRESALDFFETVRLPAQPLEVRQHDDETGTYKSFFIPNDARATSH